MQRPVRFLTEFRSNLAFWSLKAEFHVPTDKHTKYLLDVTPESANLAYFGLSPKPTMLFLLAERRQEHSIVDSQAFRPWLFCAIMRLVCSLLIPRTIAC